MKLHLISHAVCPYVHRATILLHEKGVAHEATAVDLSNKPEWFLKLSPRGRVPVLVADETPIFESMVIVEFLDETHPPRITPEDPFERARQRSWCEVANDLFMAQYKLTTASSQPDHDAAISALSTGLVRLEDAVRGPFFGGDRFGLTDVAAAPVLFRLKLLESKTRLRFFETTPKVGAWAALVAEHASVTKTPFPGFEEVYLGGIRAKAPILAGMLVG